MRQGSARRPDYYAIVDPRGRLIGSMFHRTHRQATRIMNGIENDIPDLPVLRVIGLFERKRRERTYKA